MSNSIRRITVLLLLVVVLLAIAPAAVAVAEVVSQGEVPAIQAPQADPVDETASWTYRFLIPTLLVVAVLVVVFTVVQYFVKVVGKRYRVIQ